MAPIQQELKPGQGTLLASSPYVFSSMLSTILESQFTNLALPEIQQQFSIQKPTAQWVMTIFYLATAISAIPLGRLADKIGYVNSLSILSAVQVLIYVVQYYINNFACLLAFRFISGFVSSGIMSARNTMNRLLPSREQSQFFLQKVVLMMNVISLIAPFIGGLIIQYQDWHDCFLLCGAIMLFSQIYLFLFTNNESNNSNQSYDWLGSLILMITITGFCLCFTFISYLQYWIALGSLTCSILFGIFFVKFESCQENPILPLKILRNPLTSIAFINLVNNMLFSGILYILPQYAYIQGISSSNISLVMSFSCLLNIIFSYLLPIVQKVVLNRIIFAGSYALLLCFSILICIFLTSQAGFIVLVVLMSACIGIVSAMIYPLTMLSVPPKYIAQVSAIPTTTRTIGQCMSYSIFSMVQQIVTTIIGNDTQAQMESYRVTFIVYIPIILTMAFVFWFRVGIQKNEDGKKFFTAKHVRYLVDDDLDSENSQLGP